MSLIDTHCHLDYDVFKEQMPEVLERCRLAGVDKMITISTRLSKAAEILAVAEKHDNIYCSIGIHPHHVHEEGEEFDRAKMLSYLDHPKVVAIGEAGLDYFYDKAPREIQKQVFRQQLELCLEKDLPIVIHTREAEEDTWEILSEMSNGGKLRGVLHCFTSADWLAEKALEIGFYISMSGIVTFKKSDQLQALAKRLPQDRLLVETDAPYLAPVPMRGSSNEPSYVKYVAMFLAELRGEAYVDFAKATTDNATRLFRF
jgi:TatD DNase family protein